MRRRSRADRVGDHVQSSATISAHKNPASSRATAAATMERTFLCAASWRNREDRRTWASHDRATVAEAVHLAFSDACADTRAVLVGPGRLTELAPQVRIAGPGDVGPVLPQPVECSPGTSPVKLMNGRARGKRRQSKTSAPRHSAPIRVTPR